MSSKLPINLENLLHQRQVEGERIEYTIPDKPNSRLQKYRVTEQGRGNSPKVK